MKYIDKMSFYKDKGVLLGIEADIAKNGRLILSDEMKKNFHIVLGSVHWLPCLGKIKYFADEFGNFKKHLEVFDKLQVDIGGFSGFFCQTGR